MKKYLTSCAAQPAAAIISFTHALAQAKRPAVLGLLAVLGTAFARPARAENATTQPVSLTQADAQSLRVRIYNPTNQPAKMQVVHLNNGHRILNQTVQTPAYGTLLKFDTLPVGQYAVVFRMGANRYKYTVDVQPQALGANKVSVRELSTRRVDDVLASAAQ